MSDLPGNFVIPSIISVILFALSIGPFFMKRANKSHKRNIVISVAAIVIFFWVGFFYYKFFVDQECVKTFACANQTVLSEKDEEPDPIVWNNLLEEVSIRGKWDTSSFNPVNNSLCTGLSTDFSKFMWRLAELPILSKKIGVKFYLFDERDNKNDPLFFILAFRVKNPETNKYELQISRFSVPVDGITPRVEVLTYSKEEKKLYFINNAGNLEQPIEIGSQVELTYEPDLKGNYLTQFYEVFYNPIGENDNYSPSNFKPYTLDSLPFSSLDGVLVQMGFGVTVGGCIQDLEYYIEL